MGSRWQQLPSERCGSWAVPCAEVTDSSLRSQRSTLYLSLQSGTIWRALISSFLKQLTVSFFVNKKKNEKKPQTSGLIKYILKFTFPLRRQQQQISLKVTTDYIKLIRENTSPTVFREWSKGNRGALAVPLWSVCGEEVSTEASCGTKLPCALTYPPPLL